MKREYYSNTISKFLSSKPQEILGIIAQNNDFPLELTQRDAWLEEITILQKTLIKYQGSIYFEYSIPRMGKRIDTILLIGPVIFILEFKIGEKEFSSNAIDQVWDYALDLKNFHETSHDPYIAPILIATKHVDTQFDIYTTPQNDKLLFPIKSNVDQLEEIINEVSLFCDGDTIETYEWEQGRYQPTPTIIEAAMALYNGHSVEEISRSNCVKCQERNNTLISARRPNSLFSRHGIHDREHFSHTGSHRNLKHLTFQN